MLKKLQRTYAVFRKIAVTALLLMTVSPSVALSPVPGSQQVLVGYGVKEASLGFTGITGLGSLDGLTYNPAVMGDARRTVTGLSLGGFGTDNILGSLAIAVPTSIGVVSVNGMFLTADSTNSFDSLLGGTVALSKPITEKLFFGFGLEFNYDAWSGGNDWGLTFDLGILYQERSAGKGFGFLDPAVGVVLKNIGKTLSQNDYDLFPGLGLGLGGSFSPLKYYAYSLRVGMDFHLLFNKFNPVVNFSMEHTIVEMIKLRFGYLVTSDKIGIKDLGPWTFGVGFHGVIKAAEPWDLNISYALVPQDFNGKSEYGHSVNISLAWGHYDRKKPETKIQADHAAFSPNLDGRQDKVRLSLDVSDNTLVDGWEVTLYDKADRPVRKFKSVDKLQLQTLTFKKAMSQIFSSKQQVDIPRFVEWDGMDSSGKLVPDGKYTYVLKAWDENKNVAEVKGAVTVDTGVPKVALTPETAVFSPNGDGNKEELPIKVAVTGQDKDDTVQIDIRDVRGNAVRTYSYNGASVPQLLKWDGKDGNGRPLPEGEYSVAAWIQDSAGNRTEQKLQNLRLVRTMEKVTLQSSGEAFAPNGNGVKDKLVFNTTVSSNRDLQRWELQIADSIKGTVVKKFTGTTSIPPQIIWNGNGDNGQKLPDGSYKAQLLLFYENGNRPKSTLQFIEIDKTPPALQVKPEFTEFSPNKDGKRDTLTIEHTVSGGANDRIVQKITAADGTEVYRKVWLKKDLPAKFVWNGLADNGKPLPEGKYTYLLEGEDKVGNRNAVKVADILLKTGLEKVAVASSRVYISPGNKDAVNETELTGTVTSKDGITRYEVVIMDAKGTPVKKFTSDKYTEKFKWDGKGDNGQQVPDGEYTYQLQVKYSYGDEPKSVPKKIVVDTVAPVIKTSLNGQVFSPNKDGRKETLEIALDATGKNDDIYTVEFLDAGKKPVRSWNWTGKVTPKILWDGLDNNGQPAPEGEYSFRYTGKDKAGNSSTVAFDRIRLVRAFEKLEVTGVPDKFSPAQGQQLTVGLKLSSQRGLQAARVSVFDSKKRELRRYDFKDKLPEQLVWDGKDQRGDLVADDNYTVVAKALFDSGNLIEQSGAPVMMDARPPESIFLISPQVFTPDGDGENDTLFVKLKLDDFSGVKEWKLAVHKYDVDKKAIDKRAFKSFSGTDKVARILQWDGKSDDGQDMVEAVQDYRILLDAVDQMGNRLPTIEKQLTVGVLVEKTPNGLRIRVSSVRFALNSAKLVGSSRQNLDKVIYIIRKILSDPAKYGLTSNYKIIVSGHTDDTGPDAINRPLSEQRAKSVYDYLISKDIAKKVLEYKGYGSSRPYKEIKRGMPWYRINDYRSRNRRVEFFIQK